MFLCMQSTYHRISFYYLIACTVQQVSGWQRTSGFSTLISGMEVFRSAGWMQYDNEAAKTASIHIRAMIADL
jgi:hypothetical protein